MTEIGHSSSVYEVCLYVSIFVRMYVRIDGWTDACMYILLYAFIYV